MAVMELTELTMERGADISDSGASLTRVFQVETSDKEDDPYDVYQGALLLGLPDIGAFHDSWVNMAVKKIDPKPFMDPIHWKITVTYGKSGGGSGEKDPWTNDPVVTFGSVGREKVLEFAYAEDAAIDKTAVTRGSPLLKVGNSAGTAFDPPATIEDVYPLITVTRNTAASVFLISNVYKYLNTINNRDMKVGLEICGMDVPKWCAWCRRYDLRPLLSSGGTKYWEESIEVVINYDTWIKQILDQGIMQMITNTYPGYPVLEYIKGADGKPVMDPVNLDGSGKRAPLGADNLPVAHYQKFHALWEEDWIGFLPVKAVELP